MAGLIGGKQIAFGGQADRFIFTATSTSATVSQDDVGNSIAYTAGHVSVYLNGVKQVVGTDVTASNGTSVVFASNLVVDDVVEVIALATFSAVKTEGTSILSTGETGGTKFLREDGDDSSSWQAIDSGSITSGAIDLAHMSVNSIDSDQYVDGSIDNAHLADDAVGVAELSATGTASSSTFLRGDNAWAAAGGGKVLQVQFDNSDTTYNNSGTPWDTKMTDLVCLITPADASNKIIIMMSTYMVVAAGQYMFVDFYKNASDFTETYNLTGLSSGVGAMGPTGSGAGFDISHAFSMVDTAGTTEEISYSISFRSGDSATVSCGNNNSLSTIIAIEIEV